MVQEVEVKFSGCGLIALAGPFFLRLVCPTIVSPQTYGLIPAERTSVAQFLLKNRAVASALRRNDAAAAATAYSGIQSHSKHR
jgi:hypothetical protein